MSKLKFHKYPFNKKDIFQILSIIIQEKMKITVFFIIMLIVLLCYIIYIFKEAERNVRAVEKDCKIAIETIFDARNWIRRGIEELCIPEENLHHELCRLCYEPSEILHARESVCQFVNKTFRAKLPNEDACITQCIVRNYEL